MRLVIGSAGCCPWPTRAGPVPDGSWGPRAALSRRSALLRAAVCNSAASRATLVWRPDLCVASVLHDASPRMAPSHYLGRLVGKILSGTFSLIA
jgi:hypothetical protein